MLQRLAERSVVVGLGAVTVVGAVAAWHALASRAEAPKRAPVWDVDYAAVAPEPVPAPVPPLPAGLVAEIETNLGTIDCELDPSHAPNTVANFMWLARGEVSAGARTGVPFYDGLTFHRVIPGFVIQGGDPNGNGTGGPGYQIADELSPDLHFDHPGVLAMANAGPNTAGSQFFITDAEAPWLDGRHAIFGQCDHLEIIHAIASVPRTPADRPIEPVTIRHVRILER